QSTDGVAFADAAVGTSLSATLTSLSSSTVYYYKVRALNGDGAATPYTASVSTTTNGLGAGTLPGSPGAPSATVLSTGDVSWTWAAASNATGYNLYLASSPATLLVSTPSTTAVLRGYDPNSPSGILVDASNASGEGPLAAPATAYTFAAAPSALAFVSVATTSVQLSWSASGNVAGTLYDLEVSTAGAGYVTALSTDSLAASLSALATSTAYSYRVRARNGDGVASAYSAVASTTTPSSLPGPAGTPAATVLSTGGVSWSWSASSQATSYQVYLATKTTELLASPVSPALTLVGLDPNAASAIVVRGVDADGAGPLSAAATAYTFANAPSGLAVTGVSTGSAALAWNANGDSAGTSFVVQQSTDGVLYADAATTTAAGYSALGLSSATVYSFRVRAANGDGVPTSYSAAASTRTDGRVPGAPGTPAAVALSTGDVSWTWAAAVDAAGYEVYLASNPAQLLATSTAPSVVLRGYDPDVPSAVVVRATDSVGPGPLSASATAYSMALPPGTLSVDAVSSETVSLSWASGGNRAGTLFELQRSTDGSSYASLISTSALSYLDVGLSSTTTYDYRVRALNHDAVGTSYSSVASTVTQVQAPGAPGTPSGSVLSDSAVLWSWTAAAGATSYKVTAASDAATQLAAPSVASFTASGYGPNSLSAVVVRGTNAGGDGPLSASATVYTLALTPTTLAVTAVASTTVSLTWNANGNPAGTRFEVQSSTDQVNYSTVSTGTAAAAALTALAPSTTYWFRERAVNGDGVATVYDFTASTKTLPPNPAAPGKPVGVALSSADVSWSWSAATDAASYSVVLASDPAVTLATTSATAVVVSGFGANGPVAVAVLGSNVSGLGPLSPAATVYTLAVAPGAPALTGVSSVAATVSWTAGLDPAGTRYELHVSTAGSSYVLAATTTSLSMDVGLLPSTSYSFEVRALNEDGVSTAFSASTAATTLPPAPGLPGTPSGTALSTADVSWSWAAASDAASYDVLSATDSATLLASTPTAAFIASGLGPNAPSGIVVRGVDVTGKGPLSASATVYTLAMPPVSLAASSPSSTTVQLVWSANGDPAGTRFEVHGSTDGTTFAVYLTTTGTAAQPALSASTTYWFKVRALNGDGAATAFSATVSTGTMPPLPGAPGTPAATVLSTGDVLWAWAAAANADRYRLVLASAPAQTLAAATLTSATLTGYGPNSLSAVAVVGNDATGDGPLSAAATAYTLAMPPAGLAVTGASSSTLQVSWSANGDPAGTLYELQGAAGAGAFSVLASTTSLSAAPAGLLASTSYTLRVRALNGDLVATAFAASTGTTTLPPAPGAPGVPAGAALGV
ncbi:MAG: fibronectin type III domain-containing protein, partial [Elusimicrobia bacterium]|nr:fibronectin type III domain-containing protein [Elusimicrobiota bacterium]